MKEWNEIWDDGKRRLSEDKLQAYLEGRLSPEEQHEVELWLSEEGFESEALEGLQELKPEETRQTVNRINFQLRKYISGKKRKRRKAIRENKLAWISILIILVLIVLAFIILRMVT